jgi:hypothetical protein
VVCRFADLGKTVLRNIVIAVMASSTRAGAKQHTAGRSITMATMGRPVYITIDVENIFILAPAQIQVVGVRGQPAPICIASKI